MIKIITDVSNLSLKRNVDAGTEEQRQSVKRIIQKVREGGDQALIELTSTFDQVQLPSLIVTTEERAEAQRLIDQSVWQDFKAALENIRRFHQKQVKQSWIDTSDTGTMLGMKIQPLDRVGVYVPGGSAALLSSVLMTVIPAQVAGVQEIVMMTPPQKNGKVSPDVLAAADLLGIEEIYKAGGAQAIAAFTYGTETVSPVDKIVGPGNIYVALAKREVYGMVDIDMIAGPSEIVVLADDQQNPKYIAADLLSQAEHDPLSSAICVTPSHTLAAQIQQEVIRQLKELPRKEIARQSIQDYGAIYIVRDIEEGICVVNQLAPEHLEVLTQDPFQWLGKIRHAGAIFLGEYSAEPVGDYFAGPNHVLPTNGTARFSSPLSVDDFVKKSSIISYSKHDLLTNADKIMNLARSEGLEGHARAIEVRMKKEGKQA